MRSEAHTSIPVLHLDDERVTLTLYFGDARDGLVGALEGLDGHWRCTALEII